VGSTVDSVSVSVASATFNNKNVGTSKTISYSGVTLSGDDAANYTFSGSGVTVADITPLALTVSYAGTDRIYDGGTAATVVATPTNMVAGDRLTLTVAGGSFADKNVAYLTSVASGTIARAQTSTDLSITGGSINNQAEVGSVVRFYSGPGGTGTLRGIKIGSASTSLLGFFGATPVVQQAAVADATDAASTQDRLNDLLARLRTLGLIAT
jgi:hypothetical protein